MADFLFNTTNDFDAFLVSNMDTHTNNFLLQDNRIALSPIFCDRVHNGTRKSGWTHDANFGSMVDNIGFIRGTTPDRNYYNHLQRLIPEIGYSKPFDYENYFTGTPGNAVPGNITGPDFLFDNSYYYSSPTCGRIDAKTINNPQWAVDTAWANKTLRFQYMHEPGPFTISGFFQVHSRAMGTSFPISTSVIYLVPNVATQKIDVQYWSGGFVYNSGISLSVGQWNKFEVTQNWATRTYSAKVYVNNSTTPTTICTNTGFYQNPAVATVSNYRFYIIGPNINANHKYLYLDDLTIGDTSFYYSDSFTGIDGNIISGTYASINHVYYSNTQYKSSPTSAKFRTDISSAGINQNHMALNHEIFTFNVWRPSPFCQTAFTNNLFYCGLSGIIGGGTTAFQCGIALRGVNTAGWLETHIDYMTTGGPVYSGYNIPGNQFIKFVVVPDTDTMTYSCYAYLDGVNPTIICSNVPFSYTAYFKELSGVFFQGTYSSDSLLNYIDDISISGGITNYRVTGQLSITEGNDNAYNAPANSLYWDIKNWLKVGWVPSTGDMFMLTNDNGNISSQQIHPGLTLGQKVLTDIVFSGTTVEVKYSTNDGATWQTIGQVLIAPGWTSSPLLIIGKGFSQDPGYTNPDFNNVYGTSGLQSVADYTNYVVGPYMTSGWAQSSSIPINYRYLDNITIETVNGNSSSYISKIEIIKSSTNDILATYNGIISSSKTLVSSDFDNSFFTIRNDFKIKAYFVGSGEIDNPGIEMISLSGNFKHIEPEGYGLSVSKYSASMHIFIDSKELFTWDSADIREGLNELSDATITIPNHHGQFSSKYTIGQKIDVYLGWSDGMMELFWTGEIEKCNISKDKKASFLTLWGRDNAKIMDDELTVDDDFVPYTTFAGTYGQLISVLNSKLSLPLNMNYTVSPNDLNVVKNFGHDKSIEVLIDACEKGGYEWFFEHRTKKLVIRPPIALNTGNVIKTYVLGNITDFGSILLTNYAFMISDAVDIDSSDKITWVKFEGLDGISAVFPLTKPSVRKEYYEQSDEWTTQSAVQQAASNYYQSKRFDRISLSIEIPFGESEVSLGDVVLCDDAKYGLSVATTKIFRVVSITHKLDKKNGWKSSLGLGDFTPQITDFL